MRGPQSAGLLLGRGDLIAAARLNNSPNSDTVCRTNKVNKEELVGMLAALELYLDQDHKAVWADWEGRCDRIAAAVADVEGFRLRRLCLRLRMPLRIYGSVGTLARAG